MARFPLILAMALACPAAAPAIGSVPDTATVVLATDSEARWVPYTITGGNQLRFTAQLDGRPVEALLDTGASVSILSRGHADRTGRTVSDRGHASAIGGRVAMGWTAVGRIDFGGLSRVGGGLNVVALPASATGNGEPLDLIIGRDLLDRFALEIDPVGRRFRLLRSGRVPFVGTRAPLTVGTAPLAYVTELQVAGRTLRPIIVDTGDGSALTLARGSWRTLPIDQPPVLRTLVAHGVGGPVTADVGRLEEMRIGQRTIRDVSLWIEPTGGFSDTARAAGRIGMGLLQRYHVLLDPGAGHMILAEPAQATAAR